MNQSDQDLVTENLMALTNAIHLGDLIPHLLSNEVFPQQLLETEIGLGSAPEQTQRMLIGLKKRGPQAMDAFVQSLMDAKQYEAVHILRPDISIPLPREKGGEEIYAGHLPDISEVVVKKAVQKYGGLRPSSCYRMESKPRGLAAIFVNEVFQGREDLHRLGASKDKRLLKDLFTQLGYETFVHEDTPKYEMLDLLNKFTQNEKHRSMDSCVVVFSSHGQGRGIMTHDSQFISVDDIREMFNNENCSLLSGKPKLFIIQACRGDIADTGVPASGTDSVAYPTTSNKPTQTDMIIANSTAPGYLANRTEKGSWYIYLLTKVFMGQAWNTRLIDMFLEINRKMNRLRADGGEKQAAETTLQSLTHQFFFNPGL